MRKITKNAFGLFSLGVLGISYATGAAAELPQSFTADAPIAVDGGSGSPSAAATETTATDSSTALSSAGPSSSASASATKSATTTDIAPSATPKATKSSSSSSSGSTSGTGTATSAPPTPSASPSATATQPATTSVTKTGASIKYKYGTVQLSVTKVNGKITNVTVVQGTATDGRARTFPTLVSAAVSAQGTSFGNISGATFTVDAFKEALTSALGMF